jgi:hypothetical protein
MSRLGSIRFREPADYSDLVRGLFAVLFAVNVYRAWTQSITCDEAYSQSLYLTGSWSQLFSSYDACHHILHTMLCKVSVQWFGLSEFTLRLPSLLAGSFYLITVYRLARHIFGKGLQFLLAAGLLSLNPLVLDFLSAARGYGLASALFLWALYQVLLYTGGDQDASRIYKAGLGLGLSVAANLTLLAPGTALAVMVLLILGRERRVSEAIDSFVVPGIVTSFVTVILPLSKAHRTDFYAGMSSLGQSLWSLVLFSLYHHPMDGRLSAILPPRNFWLAFFASVLVPAVLLAAGVACLVILYRWMRHGDIAAFDGPSRCLLVGGGSLLLAVLLLVALHAVFKTPYPGGRTGLYLIPLFTLVGLALPASLAYRRGAFLVGGGPLWVVGLACLGHYLVHFQVTHYGEWRCDAATKKIVQLLRNRHGQRPTANASAGVSWVLEPGLNFYRRLYGLGWLEPLIREIPDADHDYYVLLDVDAPLIRKRGLKVLYSDRFAGVSLAERVDSR